MQIGFHTDEPLLMQLNKLQLKSEQQEREISLLGNRVEKQEDEMKHMKRNYFKVLQLVTQSFTNSALFEESSGILKHDDLSPAFQLLPTEERRIPRSLPVIQNTKKFRKRTSPGSVEQFVNIVYIFLIFCLVFNVSIKFSEGLCILTSF